MIVKQIKARIFDPSSATNDDTRKPWNAQPFVADKLASIFNAMASLI